MNVAAENTSQKIVWKPNEADWLRVSIARIAQTVKKIMSKRKSDFLSLRFSTTASSVVAIAANAYPPCVFGSSAEPEGQFAPTVNDCQGPRGQIDRRYTPPCAARIRRDHRRRWSQRPRYRRLLGSRRAQTACLGATRCPRRRRGQRTSLARLYRLDA